MKLDLIKHRDILGLCLNEFGLTGEMTEIGAAFGGYSRVVLSQWKGAKYHIIDPLMRQPPNVYREQQFSQDKYDGQYADCLRLAKEDNRVNVIRDYSVTAATQFKPLSLDCVYIDGNHSYEAVLKDMDAWWPKVKIGGIMGGHDFQNKTDDGWFCEVERAVIRWASEHGKVFYVCPCSSWFIHKTSP